MPETIDNVIYIVSAGLLLLAGVFILRFVLKFAWKIVRAGLIIVSLLFIAGYFFGFFEIALR